MANILAIDDDEEILFVLKTYLNLGGHTPFLLKRGDRVLKVIEEENIDLTIVDILMPGVSGGAVYQMIRHKYGLKFPIIISSSTQIQIAPTEKDTMMLEMPKPVDREDLMETIDYLLRKSGAHGATKPDPEAK